MTYIDWIAICLHTIGIFAFGWFIGVMKEHKTHYRRLKKKMDEHFKNQSPEDAVKEFQEMGYEFEPIKQNKMSASDYRDTPKEDYWSKFWLGDSVKVNGFDEVFLIVLMANDGFAGCLYLNKVTGKYENVEIPFRAMIKLESNA